MLYEGLRLCGYREDPRELNGTSAVLFDLAVLETGEGIRGGAVDEAWLAPREEMRPDFRLADTPVQSLICNETD